MGGCSLDPGAKPGPNAKVMNTNPNLGSRGGWPADIAAKQTPKDQHDGTTAFAEWRREHPGAPLRPLTLDRATLQAVRDAAYGKMDAYRHMDWNEAYRDIARSCDRLDAMLSRAESKEKGGKS